MNYLTLQAGKGDDGRVYSQEAQRRAESVSQPTILSVRDLDVRFGGVHALAGLSFDVHEGEILALIGPNGAGKTTVFNTINGFVRANAGSVEFAGEQILGQRSDQVSRKGLARTFQHLALVPDLTVHENILIGAHARGSVGWLRAGFRLGVAKEERMLAGYARDAAEQLGLAELSNEVCASLGLPMLKLVEVARAVASGPRLLLLDEPANGLTHSEVEKLGQAILRLRDELSISFVMVEHHMGLVRQVADRLVVMDFGSRIAEGEPTVVLDDPTVRAAYLGGGN